MKIRKKMNRALIILGASCVSLAAVDMASAAITIATVPVGNPGNAPDPSTGEGEVDYSYNIGEYDVTSSQYTAFLNAVAATDTYGVYNSRMAGTTSGNPGIIQSGSPGSYTYTVAAGRGNYPVTQVTFWDTARFANWLDNGQPTGPEGPGTTETGAYTLTSTGIANNTITRNANITWAVESQNEWYKAAYYDPANGSYSLYPTQSNTITTSQANYSGTDTTPVGSYAYPSYYGTYDQGGDVADWNDTIINFYGSYRDTPGGSWSSSYFDLQSGYDTFLQPAINSDVDGFRVVEVAVPEPASLGILGLGVIGILGRRRGAGR